MIPRLHVGQPFQAGRTVELPERAAHHVVRVLRLRPDDKLVLFNGEGGEWSGRIAAANRDRVAVRLDEWRGIERESPLAVTLAQGISSGDRMDLTVQKAVELGVAAIQPLLTERSVVRLDAARGEARRSHWERVAIAACEQCGRNRVPAVREVMHLADYCSAAGDPLPRLVLVPEANATLRDAQMPDMQVTLAIGPESGFSDEEVSQLGRAGFQPMRLGPRILRTETAAPAALAALNALRGDF